MVTIGPRSRFRIYTTPASYRKVIRDILFPYRAGDDDLAHFCEAVKERMEVPLALCVPQARVGLFLAVRALISPGRKVVLSPYTIHDVVNMVISAGGVPVFADIDRETCNLNPGQVEELIDKDTGAVLVTHLHGLVMDVADLVKVCRHREVALIEDAAQAFSARLQGRPAGSFGDAGIYSFGMYKNLNTFYGGMMVTRHEDLYRRLASELARFPVQELGVSFKKAVHGLITDMVTWPPVFRSLIFRLFRFGFLHNIEFLSKRVTVEDNPQIKRVVPESYLRRMRPAQARIGLLGITRVERDTLARIAFARRYHEGLKDMDRLILPPFREDGSHIYAYYPIQFSDRHALVRYLMKRGCDVAVQHLKNCADLDCFKEFHRDCPNARATANETILLPTYPRYGREDVDRNIQAIRAFFGRKGAVP